MQSPKKPSIAVAYDIQSKNKRKKNKKKESDGGQVPDTASGNWGKKENTPTDTKTFSDQLSSAFGSPVKKASGGMIEADDDKPLDIEPASHEEVDDPLDIQPATDDEMNDDHDKSISGQIMRKKMAFGGKAEDDMEPAMPKNKPEPSDADEHYASIADAILAKKRMADGGVVDIDENAEEEPNNFDDLNYEALKKEDYSEADAISPQPEDSNEHGDDLDDEDKHDMVEAIRKKIKSKRGM